MIRTVAKTLVLMCATSTLLPAQTRTLLVGASFGGGFSAPRTDQSGLTGSVAGQVAIAGANVVLSANVAEWLLIPTESTERIRSGDASNNQWCQGNRDGRVPGAARCGSPISTRAVYSPTIELGFASETNVPLLFSVGYRAGDMASPIAAFTLLSAAPNRSHSFIRLAGGMRSVVLSIGVNTALRR